MKRNKVHTIMPKKFKSKFNNRLIEKFEITDDDLPSINENQISNFERQINEDNNQDLNGRTKFMIGLVNKVTNANLEFVEEDYNRLGRSEGYLNEMSKAAAWSKLQDVIAELPKDCWMSIPENIRIGLLKTFAVAVSR